jgi:hypothetical protein
MAGFREIRHANNRTPHHVALSAAKHRTEHAADDAEGDDADILKKRGALKGSMQQAVGIAPRRKGR